ncbi:MULTISPECIES: hypothetical protein [unclassified Micromonospora]|uniref:hypothetical protein n=1 Tax=unclassified Micromonospora TaxID=2617518 RepID=UPI00332015F0
MLGKHASTIARNLSIVNRFDDLPRDDGIQPTGSTQRQAYDMVAERYGPGWNAPPVVIGVDADEAGVTRLARALAVDPDVDPATPPKSGKDGESAMPAGGLAGNPCPPPTGLTLRGTRYLSARPIRADLGRLGFDGGNRNQLPEEGSV